MMTITVYGNPAPQGSKRFLGVRGGKGIMVESSKAVKPWREAVKWAAIDALAEMQVSAPTGHGMIGYSGPISVHMVFTLPKPKSAPKRVRSWPDRKPDLSKLVRSTEDALTDSTVWEDDARIVRLVATKCYPGEGADSLRVPGAVIHISEVKE